MPAHGEGCSISKKPAPACNRKKMFCCPNQPGAWDRLGTERTPHQHRPAAAGWHPLGRAEQGLVSPQGCPPSWQLACFKLNSSISSGRRCWISPWVCSPLPLPAAQTSRSGQILLLVVLCKPVAKQGTPPDPAQGCDRGACPQSSPGRQHKAPVKSLCH